MYKKVTGGKSLHGKPNENGNMLIDSPGRLRAHILIEKILTRLPGSPQIKMFVARVTWMSPDENVRNQARLGKT